MHAAAGVHAAPKWKHVPAPPARHVKYAPTPGWNAHDGAGQPRSGTIGSVAGPGAGFFGAGVGVGAAATRAVVGACAAGAVPDDDGVEVEPP